MMKLKAITYEEERLQFFTERMNQAQKKYHKLFKQFHNAPYLSDEYTQLCDAERESNFYCDIVEILERSNNNAE